MYPIILDLLTVQEMLRGNGNLCVVQIHIVHTIHCLICYSLASLADSYLTFAVRRAYQQAVDNRHCDVELLEYLRRLFYLTRLYELVETLFGEYQCHQVLLHGVLIVT